MKVCVAEDDFASRAMLISLLKKWGYDPIPAENGDKALVLLQAADAPRLILLDRNMPGMGGLEVIRRVRALDDPVAPFIIILTGTREKESVVDGLNAGANDYVTKPFEPEVLRARIDSGKRMLELQSGLVAARDALAFEASHDPLTGVLNRRAIVAVLSQELSRAKRVGNGLVIGIFDIDHFKWINDTHGHLVGDEALRGFTKRLGAALREYDSLGRWGGEEFLVISPGVKTGNACLLYERLRSRIADDPIPASVPGLALTVSIGLAVYTGGETADGLIGMADRAMYRAKTLGRNRVCSDVNE